MNQLALRHLKVTLVSLQRLTNVTGALWVHTRKAKGATEILWGRLFLIVELVIVRVEHLLELALLYGGAILDNDRPLG